MCTIDTRDRHSINISVDPRLTHGRHLGRQTFNFRWHSMEWRSILAMTTHWMSVYVSIATGRLSSVNDVSVVCRDVFFTVSLLPGGVLPYMGYIGMCGPKGYGFSALLVINWVSILAILPPFWSYIGYRFLHSSLQLVFFMLWFFSHPRFAFLYPVKCIDTV